MYTSSPALCILRVEHTEQWFDPHYILPTRKKKEEEKKRQFFNLVHVAVCTKKKKK